VESVAIVVNAKQPFGVAFGLALLRHLKDAPWLSKDVVLLAWWPTNTTEAQEVCSWLLFSFLILSYLPPFLPCMSFSKKDYRIYSSLESWLREYHEERPFAGIIRAALCLSIPSLSKFNIKGETLLAFRRTVLSLEGANGQLPNLDLPALFVDRLGRRDKSRVSLHPSGHPTLSFFRAWTKSSPRSSLLTFMFDLAKGIPTGVHGLFNQLGLLSCFPYRLLVFLLFSPLIFESFTTLYSLLTFFLMLSLFLLGIVLMR
jgi:hypothetical protein